MLQKPKENNREQVVKNTEQLKQVDGFQRKTVLDIDGISWLKEKEYCVKQFLEVDIVH
jgi:hypothetical protein